MCLCSYSVISIDEFHDLGGCAGLMTRGFMYLRQIESIVAQQELCTNDGYVSVETRVVGCHGETMFYVSCDLEHEPSPEC